MITPIEMDIILKMAIAAVLGGMIGIERELHQSPGGIRTHALVCMGAALFTLMSLSFGGVEGDASRVAGGIVTGIGFLAAGAIIRTEDKVHGLTTAAELWVLAAIGISVGMGLFIAAAVTTMLVVIILGPLKALENKSIKKQRKRGSLSFPFHI